MVQFQLCCFMLNYIVTLVRLSLVTIKATCLLAYYRYIFSLWHSKMGIDRDTCRGQSGAPVSGTEEHITSRELVVGGRHRCCCVRIYVTNRRRQRVATRSADDIRCQRSPRHSVAYLLTDTSSPTHRYC